MYMTYKALEADMINTNFKIIVITLGLLILAGCKPAAKDGARAYTTNQRQDVVNTGNGSVFQNNCPSGQAAIGSIYDANNSNAVSFENRVKAFLSATTLPDDVGSISSSPTDSSTGVRFQTTIKLDASGRVVGNQSKITITIYDSLVASQGLDPIAVSISSASAGQFNVQTGQGYVTFKDAYGEVRLDGTVNNQNFAGTVSFTNYTTVVQNAAVSSGPLGQFSIVTCGAIQ
jgi:hypothetical protein